jgi:DNA-binding NarL/FixJ family response regulator
MMADASSAAATHHAPASSAMLAAADGDHGVGQKMAMPITAGAQLLKITPRQYEVLVLLSRGYPIKTVSRMLNISVATAKTHACTLYQRLQVKNKGEAVYTALQRGATLDWDSGGANGSSYERNRL